MVWWPPMAVGCWEMVAGEWLRGGYFAVFLRDGWLAGEKVMDSVLAGTLRWEAVTGRNEAPIS